MRAADGRSAPHRSASREQTGRAVPAEAEARASVIHHSSRPYVCAAGARDSGSRPPSPEPPPPHPPPCAGGGEGGWGGPGEDTWPGSCGDVGRAHDSGPAGHLVASLRLQAWGLRSPGAWGGDPSATVGTWTRPRLPETTSDRAAGAQTAHALHAGRTENRSSAARGCCAPRPRAPRAPAPPPPARGAEKHPHNDNKRGAAVRKHGRVFSGRVSPQNKPVLKIICESNGGNRKLMKRNANTCFSYTRN